MCTYIYVCIYAYAWCCKQPSARSRASLSPARQPRRSPAVGSRHLWNWGSFLWASFTRALLFGVSVGDPDCWKLPCGTSKLKAPRITPTSRPLVERTPTRRAPQLIDKAICICYINKYIHIYIYIHTETAR